MCFFYNENLSKEIKARQQGLAFFISGIFELSLGEWAAGVEWRNLEPLAPCSGGWVPRGTAGTEEGRGEEDRHGLKSCLGPQGGGEGLQPYSFCLFLVTILGA